jgi:hypothetical protein
LSAIYLHNAALARLARACAREPEGLAFVPKIDHAADAKRRAQLLNVARPPTALSDR